MRLRMWTRGRSLLCGAWCPRLQTPVHQHCLTLPVSSSLTPVWLTQTHWGPLLHKAFPRQEPVVTYLALLPSQFPQAEWLTPADVLGAKSSSEASSGPHPSGGLKGAVPAEEASAFVDDRAAPGPPLPTVIFFTTIHWPSWTRAPFGKSF